MPSTCTCQDVSLHLCGKIERARDHMINVVTNNKCKLCCNYTFFFVDPSFPLILMLKVKP